MVDACVGLAKTSQSYTGSNRKDQKTTFNQLVNEYCNWRGLKLGVKYQPLEVPLRQFAKDILLCCAFLRRFVDCTRAYRGRTLIVSLPRRRGYISSIN